MDSNSVSKLLNAVFASTKALIDAMVKSRGRVFGRFLPIRQKHDRMGTRVHGLVSVWHDDGYGGVTCLN